MGGGRQYPFPKWVWSPAGAWWHNQPNGKRNTIIYLIASAGILAMAYNYSEAHTVVYKRNYIDPKPHKEHSHDAHH